MKTVLLSKVAENWNKFTDKATEILPAIILIGLGVVTVVVLVRFMKNHIK